MIYCKIENGIVVDRTVFASEMPEEWPCRETWVANEQAQIGWTYAGGVFEVPPPAPAPAPAIADVKAEAHRRIVAIMPEYQQINVMAMALETTQLYGADPSNWPADLQAANTAAMAAWTQIKAIRAKSDQIEAMNPIPADFREDGYWA